MQPRDLSDHSPYVPGRGVEEVARDRGLDPDDLIKLSSNENPHGPSPAAVEAIHEHADRVHQYPKSSHTDLTAKLAAKWDVPTEQVWVSPGADGSIDYLSRAALEPGDAVLAPTPGFAYYGMSARYHHGEVSEYALSPDDDFAQDAETVLTAYGGERIVYLTSPHNPSGSVMPLDEVRAIADATAEETLVVVDEAYGEFTEVDSAVPLTAERDDVAVLRTFSKAYGLAGLRVGYCVVPEAWGEAYARVNTPFAASELGCRAALAALDDEEHVAESVETARWAREYIADELDAPTVESAGNFVLAEVGDAERVAEEAQERGVIIRDCTSFGLPSHVRISTGTREGTCEAVDRLNETLSDLELGARP
ncbi:histidinol-phosphate aminotransferase [Halorubrum saccharovorum DSM 1137]|uniref:Histidinol-phosphate aminotransferase n=1 Tax=Halorubrum saccharovorum DSM 1137 TaxID=1227484 RepID=M0E989_9EURY|nr:histidinol-phosphate transaminase [Halorubrum saccharovorum]ELZ43603.1 histidinol-phosphate aminotransferase [Halorubrum saccharovorum DSM 1137]